jgi:cysteine desulfurase/selenocysteine lyase
MQRINEQPKRTDAVPELLNPSFIAQVASRLFNDFPEAGNVPRHESDFQQAPESATSSVQEHTTHDIPGNDDAPEAFAENILNSGFDVQHDLPWFPDDTPAREEHDLYFFQDLTRPKEEPLEHHANKLTDQQTYSGNSDGSYGFDQFLNRTAPVKPAPKSGNPDINRQESEAFFQTLNSGLPAEDEISFSFLFNNGILPDPSAPKVNHATGRPYNDPLSASGYIPESPSPASSPGIPGGDDGTCLAEELYQKATGDSFDFGSVFQSFQQISGVPHPHHSGAPFAAAAPDPSVHPTAPHPSAPYSTGTHESARDQFDLAGKHAAPFDVTSLPAGPYYFLNEPPSPLGRTDIFDVTTIRKDFPVLHQSIHGKPLVWFDNAATTQKPLSVINAVSQFYTSDNSNIHRGAHTLAARATDAYEGAREKIRQFIGAGSTSEIIYVRGTTEGINLVAQTWGRKFLQPGDEIVLSILEHHANIVPWQMVAQERGARIRVVPVNDRGEILLDEYTRLLGPRTRFVSLTQASNGLGTVLPVKEMIQLAKRYDAKVLIDGAQSVAHIPVNVQDLDADFFVFSGHKIFAPTGIGVVYGKRELLELMPPWQAGGNMIKDVTFEQTIYNVAPAKFEAGTPSIGDAVGLGAALDYVRKIGLENIARYEHELTEYATSLLAPIPGLRLIGTARNKVGVLSFVLKNMPNEEVGKLLDREGIAVRAGHHCTQPSLRRFGVEGTVRPSLAFYNTKEEIDHLASVVRNIQRR